jgi:hypothetical protein
MCADTKVIEAGLVDNTCEEVVHATDVVDGHQVNVRWTSSCVCLHSVLEESTQLASLRPYNMCVLVLRKVGVTGACKACSF